MTDPSSSTVPNQSGSSPGSQAPQGASASSPQGSQQQQSSSAPARPASVLDAEWDTATSRPNEKFYERINRDTARLAEYDVRKNTLPKSDAEYQIKLPGSFQTPAGVTFEFDQNSPELAQARKIALARGMDQDTFSDMLGIYAASKISEQTNAAKAREANMAQLGAAGQQRVDAVATWLTAKAGDDGKAVANFIKQYPSAPIVRAVETLIKQFSSQGGADFSQSGRAQEEEQGKIPGYENMSFVERRVNQMARQQQQRPNGPAGGGGR